MVENAIYHGVRELEKPIGVITVRGYYKDDYIYLEVEDNGIGVESQKMERINQCFQDPDPEEHHFFGLRNVHERIRLAFGKEYGLHLAPSKKGGVLVTVTLPLI